MMSDLPHIMYHPKKQFDNDEIREAKAVIKTDIKKKARTGGLAAALGLNLGDIKTTNQFKTGK